MSKGIGAAEHDGEGRVITAEFKDFFLVSWTHHFGSCFARTGWVAM